MSEKHNIIKLRRGTAAEWASSEPQPGGEVLKLGEPGFEKDTYRLKIGDGITPWNSLPYIDSGFGGENGPLEYIYDVNMGSDSTTTPTELSFFSITKNIDYSTFYNDLITSDYAVSLKLTKKNNPDTFFIAKSTSISKNYNTGYIDAFWPSSSIQWIIDGGDDQYDSANFINNNITTPTTPTSSPGSSSLRNTSIPYNAGLINDNSEYWGANDYVTLYKKNIFAMVSLGNVLTMPHTVYYAGNVGADGDGDKDIGTLTDFNGYQAGYCRIWGDDPTYTKLIITKTGTVPTYSTDIDNDTDDDLFVASGISSDTIAMVVFYADDTANPSSIEDIQALFESFVNSVLVGSSSIQNIRDNFYNNHTTIYNSVDSSFWYPDFEFFTGTNNGSPNTISAQNGSGSGLTFDVSVDQDTMKYIVSINNTGINYQSGDIVVLRGDNLDSPNGRSPDEDIYILIDSVDVGGEVLTYLTITNFTYTFNISQILARSDGFRFVDGQTYYLNIDVLGLDVEDINDIVNNAFNTNLIAGDYINLNYSEPNLTISATGLQPSGNYSVAGHTHLSTDITDFDSSVSGLIPVKDIVAGTGIGVSSTSGIYTINSSNNVAADTLEPDGFVNRTDSIISFNDGSREFSIAPKAPATSYAIYNNGTKIVKNSTETITIPDTTDLYFIHFDKSTNNLSYKTTGFDFDTDIPIAQVYYNADDDKAVYFGEERHGIRMDASTHRYLHNVFGTQYINGLSISNYSTTGDGTNDSDITIAIGNGLIYDEDIEANITHSDTPNDPFEQVLYPIAQIPVYYKVGSSGAWTDTTANNYPVKTGTTIQYNLNSAGTWSASDSTNPANNRFIAYWICATTQENAPIISIMGQRIDSSLVQAQSNNSWSGLNLSGLPIVELRPLYRLIYDTKNTFSNTSKGFLTDVLDIRSHIDTVTGLTQNDHGSLYGLADDDHYQYVHIDNARTIGAVHTFVNGLNAGYLSLGGNTVSSTNTNGPVIIAPNGSGPIQRKNTGNARGSYATDWQEIRDNVIKVASGSYSVIGGGRSNRAAGSYSTVGGGYTNTSSAFISTIGGGFYNAATDSYSVVAGGYRNTASAAYSSACGGRNNTSSGYASTIGGGHNNTSGPTSTTTVCGGYSNTASNTRATVCGGQSNTASGTGSFVGGGQSNTASNTRATVSGGTSNTASATNSVVSGGQSNTSSGTQSAVGGGRSNTASGTYSTVPGGNRGKSTRHGELSHAAGFFASDGDAQHSILVARRTTTNATSNQVLFLDNSSARLILPAKTAWTFSVKISAYNDTDGEGGWWIIRGGIRRNGSNGTALIGSLITESGTDTSLNSASASVVADDTNEALEIRVTGVASKNIRWVAVVDISQVSYGTP